jgi:hypothetical protein
VLFDDLLEFFVSDGVLVHEELRVGRSVFDNWLVQTGTPEDPTPSKEADENIVQHGVLETKNHRLRRCSLRCRPNPYQSGRVRG